MFLNDKVQKNCYTWKIYIKKNNYYILWNLKFNTELKKKLTEKTLFLNDKVQKIVTHERDTLQIIDITCFGK